MSEPTVSTIIPAYRAQATIRRAVDSVLRQTLVPEEVLVVDDGSPDDLVAALESYGDRVTLIRQANGGVASARNLGIERSRGDVIAFLDADDYWEPTRVARQVRIFQEHPEVGLVASATFSEPLGKERVLMPWTYPYHDRVLVVAGEAAFDLATKIVTSSVMVSRRGLANHRFEMGLVSAEDRDLWMRLVLANPTYIVGEPLATLVLEENSLSRSGTDLDWTNMLRVVHRFRDVLGRAGLRKWEAYVYRNWAAAQLGRGRPEAAVPIAWQRLRRQPFSLEAWWILVKSATLACTW